jgi:hypothetical protein
MILKGSQRGGAGQLARHLLRTDENEHVEVHDLRGFMSDHLAGALREAYAVSRGTRCQQFLFSVSLNPPQTECVPVEVFERAIDAVETKLGLTDHPRAIVFHEKEGRRHAHVVWSRIDTESMTAVNLPYFKLKLRDISKELYRENDWKMPRGLVDSQARDPANFSREEWQQAKRAGQDTRALKTMFQECWAISDSRAAFAQALEERGFYLAQGDRRGYVALDYKGEVYAISRWCGIRTKQVKARLGDPVALPKVEQTKARISERMTGTLRRHVREAEEAFQKEAATLAFRKADLVQRQRAERQQIRERQEARWTEETNARARRLPLGLKGLWFRITGKYGRIRRQNEEEAARGRLRDRAERQALIERQLAERQVLQKTIVRARRALIREIAQIYRDIGRYLRMEGKEPPRLRDYFLQTRGRPERANMPNTSNRQHPKLER